MSLRHKGPVWLPFVLLFLVEAFEFTSAKLRLVKYKQETYSLFQCGVTEFKINPQITTNAK